MTGSSPANHENKSVIPAQAGIQNNIKGIDSCFRRNDNNDPSYFLSNTNDQNLNDRNKKQFRILKFEFRNCFGFLNLSGTGFDIRISDLVTF